MPGHPYSDAAPYRSWRQAMSKVAPGNIDPVVRTKFRIAPTDRVATFGSCFAQHIARALRQAGFGFLDTETAHPLLPPDLAARFGYGTYSARSGNIYTARQLLQLWRRAEGTLRPLDDVWQGEDGRFYDPFRPAIQPGGFATRREYELDRAQHLAAVRTAFRSMDVLVFTLGLTECWASLEDGCVYPVCPGTVAGRFDPARHGLLNFGVEEVAADLRMVLSEVRAVNPGVRTILTVSPVALAATALDRHVLVSTVYSKSVLRVAAEMLAEDDAVAYFPSYEVVTGAGAAYFAADRRSVTQEGVDHVMRLFLQHATEGQGRAPAGVTEDYFERARLGVAVLCEEEALDPG